MTGVLVDNDVIIKVVAYDLGQALLDVLTVKGIPPSMLAVGQFVVRDRLTRRTQFANGAAALGCFDVLLSRLLLVEPTEQEIALAADFESTAARLNLALDSGESQLVAILITRAANLLITGDKRAIRAIEAIAVSIVKGRVACFEQLIATIVEEKGVEKVQIEVWREPEVDKAIAICFCSTSRRECSTADVLTALESYVADLREKAPNTLLAGLNLSALAA